MKRRFIVLAALGIGLMAAPARWYDFLAPADARCLHCAREFRAGTGYVMCRVCRHAMTAESAKQYFKQRPDVPFLFAPTVKVTGPVPSYVTER